MKKLLSFIVVIFLVCTGIMTPQVKEVSAATTTIDLISINDFHGRLEEKGKDPGLAKVASYIKDYQAKTPNTAVLAAGDLFQGSPLSNLTKGDVTARALKELNVQYSAIGNHEFDWEPAQTGIPKWEQAGGFPFLAANIYDVKTGQRVSFAKPTAMITVGGKQIGLIGIATPETAYKTNLANIQGLEFRDPVNDINTLAVDLKAQGADAVVVLSHLGAMQDEWGQITGEAAEAAKKIKGVQAIITGHTHQTIQGMVNGVSIVQAASYGRAVAHTKLTFDDVTGGVVATPSVVQLTPQIKTLSTYKPISDIIAAERGKLGSLLDVPVAENPSELKHGRYDELSPLGQYFSYLIGQQLVDKGYLNKQPIVLMNGGGFRDPIGAGTITQGTMYNIMPFDNYLVTMDLTKAQIKKNIENGIMNTNVGWVQYSGLTVYYDPSKPAGERITEMYYTRMNETGVQEGVAERLVDGRTYTVVTNDFMFTGGDLYDFSGAQNVKTYDGDLMRDSVQAQLNKLKIVTYQHVPRLLAIPSEENQLPVFNTNIQSFEYNIETGIMYQVDAQGNKVAYTGDKGVGGRFLLDKMTGDIITGKSMDVSQDNVQIVDLKGTLFTVLNTGEVVMNDLKRGETYTLEVFMSDGKVAPGQTRLNDAAVVSKLYNIKVVGNETKLEQVAGTQKTVQEKPKAGHETFLPDTSGKENNFLLAGMLSVIMTLAYLRFKKQR